MQQYETKECDICDSEFSVHVRYVNKTHTCGVCKVLYPNIKKKETNGRSKEVQDLIKFMLGQQFMNRPYDSFSPDRERIDAETEVYLEDNNIKYLKDTNAFNFINLGLLRDNPIDKIVDLNRQLPD